MVEYTAQNPFERFRRRPAEGARRADRARARPVGRRGLRGPAGQGLPQPVRGRLPGAPSRQEAGRPRLHRAVHAAAAGSRRRGQRQGQGGRPAAPEQPGRDRHAAAGRRAGRGSVRPGGRRHDRRRQPLLLHHEGHEGRRAWWWTARSATSRASRGWTCRPTSGTRIRARSAT